jgi:hypothetical protein
MRLIIALETPERWASSASDQPRRSRSIFKRAESRSEKLLTASDICLV